MKVKRTIKINDNVEVGIAGAFQSLISDVGVYEYSYFRRSL